MNPTFSVILPLRNVAPWLSECLASLRAQTWRDWEGRCVDDGSTDGSGRLLAETLREDPRLHAIFQPPSGVSRARNRALGLAQGDAVAFLDGDDTVQNWWLAEARRLFQETRADLVRFKCRRLLAGSTLPKRLPPPGDTRHTVWEGGAARERETQTIPQQGACWLVLLRTSLARKAAFCERLRIAEDSLYLLHLTPHLRRLCESDATPYDSRVHAGSAMINRWSADIPLAVLGHIAEALRERPPLSPEALAHVALVIVLLWSERRIPAERRRFGEVRVAFATLFRPNEGKEGLRPGLLRAHWRPAARCYLLGFGPWGLRFVSWVARRCGAFRARFRHA